MDSFEKILNTTQPNTHLNNTLTPVQTDGAVGYAHTHTHANTPTHANTDAHMHTHILFFRI